MAVVDTWVNRHEAIHPRRNDDNSDPFDPPHFGGYSYISNEVGHSFNWSAIRRARHMGFSKADEILVAIGEELAFHDGRVRVIPNPVWSQEHWLAWKENQGCV